MPIDLECKNCDRIGEFDLHDIAIALDEESEKILLELLKLKKKLKTSFLNWD